MLGPPSLTKSFQLHGLQLVCLEVVISIGVLCTRALRARRASHLIFCSRLFSAEKRHLNLNK